MASNRQAIDLISKLLKVEGKDRLTMVQIFGHPWISYYEKAFNIKMDEYIPGFESARHAGNNTSSLKKEVRFDLGTQANPGILGSTAQGTAARKVTGGFGSENPTGRLTTPQNEKPPQEARKSFLEKFADFFGCGSSNS